ncbi:hypothetical protein SMD44_p10077 (plasmid) [Streptomyces alboflavus]|uniref:DUF6545 domain-containing protein n=1 Tax=Streptomyces alboflavus TaxID=67267 RepID=A0A291W4J5_9ACTN|nr:MAB_1171c family putative transporter [Streptomyces alboflavus]ATM24576.1 hypothetical protein SMD44_p10077 [Streptomyces alboflavus]
MSYAIFFVALAAAMAWKSYQRTRAPDNPCLRWLTRCLGCAAAAFPLSVQEGRQLVDGVFVAGTAKLLQDVLVLAMCLAILVFYLYSAGEGPAVRQRVRREIVVFAGVVTVVMTTALTSPHRAVLHSEFHDADMTAPQALTFYGGLGMYMLYALSAAGLRTFRYARMSRGPDAVGLWTVTAGLVGMVATTAARSLFMLLRAGGVTVSDGLTIATGWMLVFSTPVFVLGLIWPGLRAGYAAGRLRLEHRRVYHRLEPLWRLLSSAYPDMVLPGTGRGTAFRYARRVIECRDGLIRIGPRIGTGPPADAMEPRELARRLQRAADDIHSGNTDPSRTEPLAVTKHLRSEAEEIRHLVAVSEALRLLPAGTA